ncbi:hypothetical protein EVAR_30427_1 [Eumeta japonica]|uniref:Uncharacterized protein n=1 Tax=Eumeta variegata TaxID=151549 RepID=A0A4C1W442_EUMVA|nr:hypothetical protein EVAR_30427_1 [Eumeta japonica]
MPYCGSVHRIRKTIPTGKSVSFSRCRLSACLTRAAPDRSTVVWYDGDAPLFCIIPERIIVRSVYSYLTLTLTSPSAVHVTDVLVAAVVSAGRARSQRCCKSRRRIVACVDAFTTCTIPNRVSFHSRRIALASHSPPTHQNPAVAVPAQRHRYHSPDFEFNST